MRLPGTKTLLWAPPPGGRFLLLFWFCVFVVLVLVCFVFFVVFFFVFGVFLVFLILFLDSSRFSASIASIFFEKY